MYATTNIDAQLHTRIAPCRQRSRNAGATSTGQYLKQKHILVLFVALLLCCCIYSIVGAATYSIVNTSHSDFRRVGNQSNTGRYSWQPGKQIQSTFSCNIIISIQILTYIFHWFNLLRVHLYSALGRYYTIINGSTTASDNEYRESKWYLNFDCD